MSVFVDVQRNEKLEERTHLFQPKSLNIPNPNSKSLFLSAICCFTSSCEDWEQQARLCWTSCTNFLQVTQNSADSILDFKTVLSIVQSPPSQLNNASPVVKDVCRFQFPQVLFLTLCRSRTHDIVRTRKHLDFNTIKKLTK